MTVVAMVTLIAAIAIPVFLRSKITSNESVAQTSLGAYRNAFEIFRPSNTSRSYPAKLSDLNGFIDDKLAGRAKNGYQFALLESTTDTYGVLATPLRRNVTGVRSFILDQSGEIQPLEPGMGILPAANLSSGPEAGFVSVPPTTVVAVRGISAPQASRGGTQGPCPIQVRPTCPVGYGLNPIDGVSCVPKSKLLKACSLGQKLAPFAWWRDGSRV